MVLINYILVLKTSGHLHWDWLTGDIVFKFPDIIGSPSDGRCKTL